MRQAMLVAGAIWLGASNAASAQILTLRRAELTQGGVGYFAYEARAEGAATLGLDLPRADVSDALRSLVVRDAAGSVRGVELPGESGGDAAFADLPIPRAALLRPLDLLRALRGVTVSVAGATPLVGRILDAEPVAVPPQAPGQPMRPARPARTRVTLLGDAGLQQFVLEDAAAVQVADPMLRAKLAAALESERGAAASDRRHLDIRLDGTGTRTVEVGMVLASPLWKAAYRLVLPGAGEDHARLQGWAVLENAGLADWADVAVTLQAGNPVAFHQDIYATQRVARPEIPVDLLDRPAPRVDEGAMMAKAAALPPPAPAPMAPPGFSMLRAPAPAAAAPIAPPSEPAELGGSGIATAFTLARPLSLAAGHTADVPFLDRALPAREVRLLGGFARHPLAAVELVNDTGAGLPPGAVTTLGGTGFAGDARLAPFPQGARRLLTFAEDAGVTADWESGDTTTLVGLTAARGVLHLTRRERHATTVTLAAADPAADARHVIVEVPREPDTTLATEPAGIAVEQTAGAWRLDVALPAGAPTRIVANADRMLEQTTVLSDDPSLVVALLGETGLGEAARTALQHVADLRATAAARADELRRLQEQRTALVADEQRIRANLGAVGATDTLRGRLVRALEQAEDGLADIDARTAAAGRASVAAQDALADAVAQLSL